MMILSIREIILVKYIVLLAVDESNDKSNFRMSSVIKLAYGNAFNVD